MSLILCIGLNRCYPELVPIDPGLSNCLQVAPSAPAELAWLTTLLVSTRPYAEPAAAELERALLPSVGGRRSILSESWAATWQDGQDGAPELVFLAAATGTLLGESPEPFLAGLADLGEGEPIRLRLLGEPDADAEAIRRRIARLENDAQLRARYRELLERVWDLAADAWRREGASRVRVACAEWERRVRGGAPIEQLLSPRHPLLRTPDGGRRLLDEVPDFVLSPLHFCMSGGVLADAGEYLHLGVPASDLHPIRRERDAAYVAGRFRVLSEPTRARLFLQVLSAPASVTDLAESLQLPQSTVSDHLAVLRRAGLLESRKSGVRTLYSSSVGRVDRLFEDARATLAIWQ
jgi:DNA-binding transcriptional ArsR family regulator